MQEIVADHLRRVTARPHFEERVGARVNDADDRRRIIDQLFERVESGVEDFVEVERAADAAHGVNQRSNGLFMYWHRV